jgi:cytochrome c peroxidase
VAVSPDGNKVAVASYFAGEVLLCDAAGAANMTRVAIGAQPPADEVRAGESIFFDATHCFQKWLSCGTCHPDTRADGLNWDLLNDGLGNPKNTRSMVWSDRTPPVMSLGVRASMEVATEKGFVFIQFRTMESNDVDKVRAYLRSLEPESSPYLVNGKLFDKAKKGKTIFEDAKTGCVQCHPAPLFTDLKMYDVGTGHELDRDNTKFDNPACVELWRTAPFLHDGSAVTLKDLLTTENKGDRHGKTSHLGQEDVDALVEYLLSL